MGELLDKKKLVDTLSLNKDISLIKECLNDKSLSDSQKVIIIKAILMPTPMNQSDIAQAVNWISNKIWKKSPL